MPTTGVFFTLIFQNHDLIIGRKKGDEPKNRPEYLKFMKFFLNCPLELDEQELKE